MYKRKSFIYLCGDSNWTCIQMTFPHHGTSQGNEWSCGKSKLVSTQQCTNYHITTSPDLSINLKDDSPAQVVQYKSLMGLGYAQFPWQPSMFDAWPCACSCSTVMTRNYNVFRVTLVSNNCDSTVTLRKVCKVYTKRGQLAVIYLYKEIFKYSAGVSNDCMLYYALKRFWSQSSIPLSNISGWVQTMKKIPKWNYEWKTIYPFLSSTKMLSWNLSGF